MIDPGALRLYLVADPEHARGDLVEIVASALAGGVTMVQLRAKALTDREHLALATHLSALCARSDVPFIVNDRIDLALAAKASGVHLGVDDLPLAAARGLSGPDFIIGYSPETDQQIDSAVTEGADYLGVGPVFGTRTKSDAGAALGIAEFGRRCALSAIPVVGIGGIDTEGAPEVMRAGAAGVAVISAVLGSPDPESAAHHLRTAIDTAHQGTTSPAR